MINSIVIVDHMSKPVATPQRFADVARALARQVQHDFAKPQPHGWGTHATVRAAVMGAPPAIGEMVLGLFDHADQPGALGYHDVDLHGVPVLKVFPLLDIADGAEWTVTASHEILETLADPELVWCAQSPIDGRIYAAEICDACEARSYDIQGVMVSDFLLPTYFAPPQDRTGVKYDFMGAVTEPYQVLPGGYSQVLTPDGWQSIDGGARAYRRTHQGRRTRRAKGLAA